MQNEASCDDCDGCLADRPENNDTLYKLDMEYWTCKQCNTSNDTQQNSCSRCLSSVKLNPSDAVSSTEILEDMSCKPNCDYHKGKEYVKNVHGSFVSQFYGYL